MQITQTITKPTAQQKKHFAPKSSRSWNYVIGCPLPKPSPRPAERRYISPGCERCYIYRILRGRTKYDPNKITPTKGFYAGSQWQDAPPMHWRQPDVIFTCSLSDFFHVAADPWRERAWRVIASTTQHRYHILTKRISRVYTNPEKCLPADWNEEWDKKYRHVWIGTTVEDPQFYWRMDLLCKIKTTLRFVSCEPLLAPLSDLKQHGLGSSIFWAFAGGESDPHHPRPAGGVPQQWFEEIRQQCDSVKVPFHFLQTGGTTRCGCGCYSRYGCRAYNGVNWFQQYPIPTLVARGPKNAKRQRQRILDALKKADIGYYKMPVQTEQRRGVPGQTDRVLLLNTISNQTVDDLQAELGNTTLTLETWPYMPP